MQIAGLSPVSTSAAASFFCSSLPYAITVEIAPMLVSTTMRAVTVQHFAISSMTKTASRKERPCPPYSIGIVIPTNLPSVSAFGMSQGYSSEASISAARGPTTVRANSRARACSANSSAASPSVSTSASADLRHYLPAVRRQRRAGDETRIVGGEEHHATRDLLRLTETPDRDQRQNVLLQHILRHRLDHLGVDVAGADRIHGDARPRAFERQRLGKANVAGLRGGIVRLPELALLAVNR